MDNKLYEHIVNELNWSSAVATGLTAAALAFGSPSGVEAKPNAAVHNLDQ